MDDHVDALVSAIYDTATDENGWVTLLSRLSAEFGAVGATYFVLDKASRQPQFWCNVGHDIAKEQLYGEHYINIDPTLDLAMRSEVGSLLNSTDYFSKSYVEHSEYFQEFMLPSRLGSVTGGKLIERDGAVGMFSIQRELSAREISTVDRHRLNILFPHLVRTAAIHWRVRHAELWRHGIEEAFRKSPQPIMVVDNRRVVKYMNSSAESMLSSNCGITVCGRILRCADADCEAAMKLAVARATGVSGVSSSSVCLTRELKNVFLSVSPISFPCSSITGDQRHALIIASPSMLSESMFNAAIGDVFHLTKSEKILAYRLYAGATVADIATELGLSRETLRTQLQAIFQKTRTNRQGQLVRLLQEAATCFPK